MLATAVAATALAASLGGTMAIAGGSHGSAAGGAYGQYGGQYKPGKGCGDKNHTHTGPPGNPSNTSCPNH